MFSLNDKTYVKLKVVIGSKVGCAKEVNDVGRQQKPTSG